jgi:hypothetical protein
MEEGTSHPTASPTPIDGMQGGEATKSISKEGDPPQEIINTAEPGDVIEVEDGVYEFSDRLETEVGGNADAPIEIRPVEGASPVFEWTGTNPINDNSGWQIRRPYWIVRGLELRGSTWQTIQIDGSGHDIVFEGLDVHDGNTWGVMNKGGDNVVYRNCDSYNHFDPQNDGENSDGFGMTGPAENGVIEGCRSWNNGDDGFDVWISRNHEIRHCWAVNNGRGDSGNGNGFKLGGGPAQGGGHRVKRCVAFGNRRRGFNWNTAKRTIELVHCTAYDNGDNYHFVEGDHLLLNNISYKGTDNIGEDIRSSSNTWDTGITNPKFASTNPEDKNFLLLSGSSPAVDAGSPTEGVSVSDGEPDLGAFEHGQERWGPLPPSGQGGD